MDDCRESQINFEKYIVLNNGEIISKHRNKPMSTKTFEGNDYVMNTFLKKDGEEDKFSRHRVIWYYFNGNIPEGMDIDHIDGNKQNNSLSNLRCISKSDNMRNPSTYPKFLESLRNPVRCRKISEAKVGIPASEEQKRKQSEAMKGKNKGVKRPEHSALMKKAKRDKFGRFVKE